MQNKGFIKFLAVALTLVSVFYLSFTVVTNKYYKDAKAYSGGDPQLENQYLDSLSKKKVWLGYTLEKCRAMEINLGLDLKGGMSVIMEIAGQDVLKSLADNNPDANFNQALVNATALQSKGQNDFVASFVNEYQKLDPNGKLAAIFGTYELRDKIRPEMSNKEVSAVLKTELKSAYDHSFLVLRNRIDKFGVVAPNIQNMDKEGQISIELPGVKDPDRVRTLLQGTANLEFWETWTEAEIHSTLIAANNIIRDSIAASHQLPVTDNQLPAEADTLATAALKDFGANIDTDEGIAGQARNDMAENSQMPLFAALGIDPSQPYGYCIVANVPKSQMAKVDSYLNNPAVKQLLESSLISLKWTVKPQNEENDIYQLIALKINYVDGRQKPILSGDVIESAEVQLGSQNSIGRQSEASVSMTMTTDAAKIWARVTEENAPHGNLPGRSIAIVLDDAVYSYPTVQTAITGGSSNITGNFSIEEANDLANVLKSGRMAARAIIVQEDVVGPSLGQQAITQGFISFIIALLVLLLYLIAMYGLKPGAIADGALLLNLFFSLGVMASFGVVLTLSGIAGIVLSLALAVDANVLVYERIREEMRGGKALKPAVEEGYAKAFSAIFDSNLTSLITGIILLIFGTGPIRGFAFTFIIGIVVSFFTALYLTHLTYDKLLAKNKLKNIKFETKLSENLLLNPNFNFLKTIKWQYSISGAIALICIISFFPALGGRGLQQGIDYTGGRNYVIKFDHPVNTVEVEEKLSQEFEDNTPSVITIGNDNQIRVSTNYLIDSQSLSADSAIQVKLYDGLKNDYLPKGTSYDQFIQGDYIQTQSKVGPSIADDLTQKAIWAVLLSVLGIGLYILFRFRDISYSIGTIAALSFDTIFVIGAYSILWGRVPFSLEVDQTFIGAVLTVIGYSVNDKVVIFDRVREYAQLYPKRGKYDLFNSALNTTLGRTFNTGMASLLVLFIIFFFGGESSIRSFSFAMILGIIIGTFSSLFIAAPVAYNLQESKIRKAALKK
ncbi:MAG: protein translocase subunit SecDF [Candidatus Symbiothrix sp.]|jgi:SecD/SecF fusion protein|nr:protein translocase subunit SecDF [Candidatus Symbiothrix sp.]